MNSVCNMKTAFPDKSFGFFIFIFFLAFGPLRNSAAYASHLEIRSNFPGGNVTVDSIVGNTVYLRPDIRDTTRDWFYWYMAVKSSKTTVVKFVFNRPHCISRMGPAFSTDNGKNWNWLWTTPLNQNEFVYEVRAGKEIRFSVGMPYTQSNLATFLKPYKKNKFLKNEVLCVTKKGRSIEKLVLSAGAETGKPKILFTAGHQSCEMMVNYVMEGMISTLLAKDSAIQKLLHDVAFVFIPFMDKDGVEDGDQGKSRFPRDHNRDYSDSSIHESTRAVREQFGPNLTAALDLHCPRLKGRDNESLYLIVNDDEKMERNTQIFASRLIAGAAGSLKLNEQRIYRTKSVDPVGATFKAWATALPSMRLCGTVEVPYALHYPEAVTPEKLRVLGREMVLAVQDFLRHDKTTGSE
jgi:hypothetical protein